MSTKLKTICYWSLAGLPFTLTQTSRFMHLDVTAFRSFFLLRAVAGMLTANPGRQRQRHRTARTYPCHTTMLRPARPACLHAIASTRSPCGRALRLCTCVTHIHVQCTCICTCKTSLGTDSAFCYRPYAAPCFFLSWYPWILCQLSVYVVGRVWHQPNFALASAGSDRRARRL